MTLTLGGLLLSQLRFFSEFVELTEKTFDMNVLRSMHQCLHNGEKSDMCDTTGNAYQIEHELSLELASSGINTPFEFAVIGRDGQTLCTNSADSVFEQQGGFYSILLPPMPHKPNQGTDSLLCTKASYPEVLPEPMRCEKPFFDAKFLRVYLPDKDAYIKVQIRPLWTITIVINIILLLIFIVAICLMVRQRRMAEEKTDFMSNMTHEFQTPIASISLAGQMLTDPQIAKKPELLNSTSTVIREETERLRFLVEKVLQTSLFDGGRPMLNFEDCDINQLVESVVQKFMFKVRSRGGQISTQLAANDSMVMVDELQISNVLFNLLDNSVKYAKTDEPLKLQVRTSNADNQVIVEIEDNGIGIPKENINRVFKKFYRIHTGNVHNVRGFGLGLAYVKGMVEKHGGTIKVESELNKGTKIIITLPTIK